VEIMNPHHGEYYLGKSTPHDAGSPITIFFLTVPEGSTFSFHVQCDPRRIPEGLDWRSLLAEAFRHAFDWCGFGAKTAVGYGAMKRDLLAEERMEEERRQAHLAAMSEEERQLASLRKTLETELENGTLSANSRVASDRVNLLRAALEWESEDLRCQAADVIEETVHHLPWSKKAKPERREQTARLRQPK
jgi:CRISPR-associated protein Cmr6